MNDAPDIDVVIPHNYQPRAYQEALYDSIDNGIRRACVVWHRRAGKDKTLLNLTIAQALQRVGVYYYCLPTYAQGKKIIWDGIDGQGFRFLDHFPPAIIDGEPNQSELKIKLRNGSLFQIIGTDNFNSIVGPNPIGCVFSEYSLMNPTAWELIRPILAENEGWALFAFTPRGHNHSWEMYNMAQTNPDWLCEVLTVKDTQAIRSDQIDQARREGMSEDMIQQEFFCSFEASITGAYYAKEIRAMREDGRICSVPPDPVVPVWTFWDLGFSDYTSIWFVQFVGKEVRLCHYYQNCGESLIHYVNYIQDWRASKGVVMAKAVLPHDAGSKSLQTGKNSLEVLSELGVECTITGRVKQKQDGIEAVRKVLPRCWIDEKGCFDGIEALTQYRKEFDDKYGVFQVHPVHDKHSHGADATQTMALWLQHENPTAKREEYSREAYAEAGSSTSWMGR